MRKLRWHDERRRIAAALCLSGAMGTVQAAPDASLSEEEFLGDMPVVLSVSRLSQPVEDAPSAVTVIDREMIKASGFRELADVFRLVPGFFVGYPSGNEPVVSAGLTNSYFGRVQVLVDGRSVYTPTFGQVQWTLLPLALEDIERIEVTRGPNAASYGANSFLGIINIITRHPSQDPGTFLSLRTGDPGVKDAVARYAGKAKGWDYRVTAGHKQDNGFDRRHDSQRIDYLSARGDYRLNTQDSIQLQAGYAGGVAGFGWFGDEFDVPRDRMVASGFTQLRWMRTYAIDDELSVQFYHAFHQNREQAITAAGSPFLPTTIRLEHDSQRFDLELQRTQGLTQSLRVVWGGSTRLDLVRAPQYLGTDDTKQVKLQRLFGHLEWRPAPAWLVNAGAMIEHNNLTGTDLAPRLAVSYHLTPEHTIRVGVSQAQRTPTLLEDAADYYVTLNTIWGPYKDQQYLSAGGLKPERILTRELAYLGNLPHAGLSFDVRFYQDDIRDIILADNTFTQSLSDDYWEFFNGNSLTRRGVETQIRWRYGGTMVSFAHSLSKVVDVRAVSAHAVRDLKRVDPAHAFSALVSHHFPQGVDASVVYSRYSNMTPFGNGGDPLLPYARWDWRLAKKFSMGAHKAELALVAQSFRGPYRDYFWDPGDVYQQNEFKRRLLTTLSLEF
jgi:iron complex outermembrane receptor protein